MTGLQISTVNFKECNFDNVLMGQSVLNMVTFEDCYVSGMRIDESILHSVQVLEGNFGNIDTAGIIRANLCEIKNSKTTDLEFLYEPFIIEPENRITVYRINCGSVSPCMNTLWDNNGKAVRTESGFGIYGYTSNMDGCLIIAITQLSSNIRNKKDQTKDILSESQVILKLEVDKNDVLLNSKNEMAFTKCNISGILTPEELILQSYPQCAELLDLYSKAMENPALYWNQYIKEERKQFNKIHQNNQTTDLQKSQFEIIKNFAVNHAKPSDIHGLSHWQNVERNGILLAGKTGADLQALRVFAYSHDMCRENDGGDPEHGMRASQLLRKHAGSLLNEIDEKRIYRLCFACEHHTDMLRSGDLLIDTCFDADRLDLTRVGITPDPAKMATEAGAYYAANPDIFKAEIQNVQI
jgi:uncharacterized protein